MSDDPNRVRRCGIVRLNAEMLGRALNIPPDHRIVECRVLPPFDEPGPGVVLLIEGPRMPEIQMGGILDPAGRLWQRADGSIEFLLPGEEPASRDAPASKRRP
jgi:hypothetical protein